MHNNYTCGEYTKKVIAYVLIDTNRGKKFEK